jgi:hypothetical protein
VIQKPSRGLYRANRLAPLLAVSLVVSLVAACADSPRGLLSNAPDAPPDIQQACALANTRCSHCHPIERVVLARGVGPRRWQIFVDEMRLKPSSGISPNDAEIIFRCLRFVDETCTNCKQGQS